MPEAITTEPTLSVTGNMRGLIRACLIAFRAYVAQRRMRLQIRESIADIGDLEGRA